jgi:ubiquinone/menaquinone biosynthesis C-methylase UbiE
MISCYQPTLHLYSDIMISDAMSRLTQINEISSQETEQEKIAKRVSITGPFNVQNINQFKDGQRRSWDSVSKGWQTWWRTFENGAQNISSRLVELGHTKPGDKILDIATGIGEPAVTAAKRAGGNGHVLATDISPQMLSIAKQRAASLGLENIIEIREGDAETIDLPASTFDAVLCRWGLMYLPNPSGALSNIHRILAPGAYFAAAVWGIPDNVPFLALPISIVRQETNAPAPAPGTPGPFGFADENLLRNTFIQARFKDVYTVHLNAVFGFNSAEDFTRYQQAIAAPVIAMLANENQSRQNEIWNKVTEAARKYSDENGHVKFINDCICVVGRKISD